MITDEVYVEIEILRKHGMSLRKIAEAVGCAVNTVRSHLEADTLPRTKAGQGPPGPSVAQTVSFSQADEPVVSSWR